VTSGRAATSPIASADQVAELPVIPAMSVVVPTFNEASNIDELLARLVAALPPDCEVIFVDDSTDNTPEVIRAAARRCPIPVAVHHRSTATGGLGGAVVEGLKLARGPWIVVMDADLQHPPALVPSLVEAGESAGADLVVASRYASGGSKAGLGGAYRALVSRASTVVSKALFTRALRGISDPMSGFFAVRASAVKLDELRPLGYKILLELAVRCRFGRVAEVPYMFGERFAGESKSTVAEGLRFLQHLVSLRLSDARTRMLVFGAVGLSGFLPNLVTLWLLADVLGMHYLPAAVIANQLGIAWNFVLLDLLFHHRRSRRWPRRLGSFYLLNNADLLVRIPLLALLVGVLGLGLLTGTVLTLVVMFLVRFFVTDRVIYVPKPEPQPAMAVETP
jgi:dolichol-phosphate mannosyltransferase